MTKRRCIAAIVGTLVILAIISVIFAIQWHTGEDVPSQANQDAEASLDIGITYLPLTPSSLGKDEMIDWGALVTEVSPGGLADDAGIRVGDVILSLNGSTIGEDKPLLGMIRSCRPGNRVNLEVWRENSCRTVNLVHTVD